MKPSGSTVTSRPEGFWGGALDVPGTWLAQRTLIWQLVQREVLKRYRGSALGLTWSVLTPLVLLTIYTMVFSSVLKMQWSPARSGFGEFALMLFCGLVPFNFLNESLSGSVMSISGSPNYVRRIAFPVEVLPCVQIGSAAIHAAISTVILILGLLLLMGVHHWTLLALPLVWLPYVVFTMAVSLFAAGIGVFIRDIGHLIGLLMSILFFLSPIFYPASIAPEHLRWVFSLNPIAHIATSVRSVSVEGHLPDWTTWLLHLAAGAVLLLAAAGWFHLVRKRFSDVL